jgi:HEAT repeat protein
MPCSWTLPYSLFPVVEEYKSASKKLSRRGPLISALGDEFFFVRQKASLALVEIGGRKTVDDILAGLDGGSDNFLEAAAATLGLLKDKRALPALEKLSKYQNQSVARAAAESIKLLEK